MTETWRQVSQEYFLSTHSKKSTRPLKDFIRQWFFPQKGLTSIPGTNESGRYHLHESQVQEALQQAVRIAKIAKRVNAFFSARFATDLLQANDDIRTIETMLAHTDVRTTMIYTRCVPSTTAKEPIHWIFEDFCAI